MGAAGLGKILFAITLISASILVWAQVFSGQDGKLHVYFFDVGQGDSALIVTPEGKQILVDGGPGYRSATATLSERLPGGDRSLDMVVLTPTWTPTTAGVCWKCWTATMWARYSSDWKISKAQCIPNGDL